MARKTPVTPPLYNPVWVLFGSLLFTPVFGGLLQAHNWEALGEHDKARGSRFWVPSSSISAPTSSSFSGEAGSSRAPGRSSATSATAYRPTIRSFPWGVPCSWAASAGFSI